MVCDFWRHAMPVVSYQAAVRVLQPIIDPIFDALQYGLDEATQEHVRRRFLRQDDPWYFLHSARRSALDQLVRLGLAVTVDDGDRSLLNLSGLLVRHGDLALRILRPEVDSAGRELVPLPATTALQAYFRQRPLPGMEGTDNLLLIWSDDQGTVKDPARLVRPVGGDARRDSLRLAWDGPLARGMVHLRAKDLDELQPEHEQRTLGGEESR